MNFHRVKLVFKSWAMQRCAGSCCQPGKRFMKLITVVCLLVIIHSSCKKSTAEANKICFSRTSTELEIENNSDKKFFFVAFGQRLIPLVDWAPSCNDNISISPKNSLHKSLSSILGYAENDALVVYYWECTGSTSGPIQMIMLEKYSHECRWIRRMSCLNK